MPPRQRLVRRRPLSERISGWLNPSDFLLWASEEIKTRDLDAASVGTKIAVGANVVFLIARANYGATITGDDVFSEPRFNWATLFAKQVVWVLALGSIINALSLTYQKRHYRLFEANLEQKPGTPSAHRVQVQSSPMSSSPMRLLAGALGSDSAESRAHPDKTRDVWEIAVWDPIPACLQGIIYFSPIHVLVYMFALPLDPMENRPSVTVFKSLVMQVILSLMLQMLQVMNDQRQKDAALVQREVMREYDTKYVHPRLHPLVRDVGIQTAAEGDEDLVETGVATTLIRRGFQTHPNPNYMKHIDPDSVAKPKAPAVSMSSRLVTPASRNRYSDTFGLAQQPSARQTRQSMPALASTPVSSTSTSTAANQQAVSTGTNFGGSLGVFTHGNSPLKKATSLNEINNAAGYASPRNSREMAAMEQREAADRMQRRETPLKLTETADALEQQQHTGFTPVRGSNPFAKDRARRFNMERYPSRW
ncbi:hypothetical protein ACKVWC_004561 [Pyricularia oryzae]